MLDPKGQINQAGIVTLARVLDSLVLIKEDGRYTYISSYNKIHGEHGLVITDEVNSEIIKRLDYSWVDDLRESFENEVRHTLGNDLPLYVKFE